MKQSLKTILEEIKQADDHEIYEIVTVAMERYKEVFPDWEILYISMPKNNQEERRRFWEYVIRSFKKYEQL